jgi:hypothetical protein
MEIVKEIVAILASGHNSGTDLCFILPYKSAIRFCVWVRPQEFFSP